MIQVCRSVATRRISRGRLHAINWFEGRWWAKQMLWPPTEQHSNVGVTGGQGPSEGGHRSAHATRGARKSGSRPQDGQARSLTTRRGNPSNQRSVSLVTRSGAVIDRPLILASNDGWLERRFPLPPTARVEAALCRSRPDEMSARHGDMLRCWRRIGRPRMAVISGSTATETAACLSEKSALQYRL